MKHRLVRNPPLWLKFVLLLAFYVVITAITIGAVQLLPQDHEPSAPSFLHSAADAVQTVRLLATCHG